MSTNIYLAHISSFFPFSLSNENCSISSCDATSISFNSICYFLLMLISNSPSIPSCDASSISFNSTCYFLLMLISTSPSIPAKDLITRFISLIKIEREPAFKIYKQHSDKHKAYFLHTMNHK